MPNTSQLSTSGVVLAKHSIGVLKLEGYKDGGTSRYLQIHDALQAPADTAVPLREKIVYGDAPFFWLFDVQTLQLVNGLYVCLSDTKEAKTLSSDTMDVYAEIDQPVRVVTVVGNLTTAVAQRELWNNAAGPNRLQRLDVVNQSAENRWFFVAQDSVSSTPFRILGPVAAAASKSYFFGTGGTDPSQVINGTLTKGCTIYASDQGPADGFQAPAGNDVTIRGIYIA